VASSRALEAYEAMLLAQLQAGLAALPGVLVHSRAARRTPTVLVTFANHSADSASAFLIGRGILAPSGSFYAREASRHLGLGDDGGLRIGLAPYTTAHEVERILDALDDFLRP
jgi:selenocysteine lyase/cysteine desulfurase